MEMNLRANLSVALVGCGAVVEQCHLPAFFRRSDCKVAALVDSNQKRAGQLAERYGIPHSLTDYRGLYELGIDAAIVALPNYLHAPASIDLLEHGIHVLVEKPMALSLSQCNAMIEAAQKKEVTLAVGLMRRFYRSGQLVRSLVQNGTLGQVRSFDVREGRVFNWPLASDFFFRKEAAGGGVLIDTGVHTLDQLLWWLGDADSFEYYDDNYGGVEADCELHLKLRSGAEGIVEVSRTRKLRNTAIIRGERGELEIGLSGNRAALRFDGVPLQVAGSAIPLHEPIDSEWIQTDPIAAEQEDFLDAIRRRRSPVVSGLEGSRSVALIEACYRKRQPLKVPWMEVEPTFAEEVAR